MPTNVIRLSGTPRVGHHPASVVSDNTDGHNLINSLKMARAQPVMWQPHLASLQPGWKPSVSAVAGDLHLGAITGDLAYQNSGFKTFNGRIFKDVGGSLDRITLVERFLQRPALNAAISSPKLITVTARIRATDADTAIYVADRAMIVVSCSLVLVANDSGEDVMLEKCASGTAPGSGTDCLSGVMSTAGTVNTPVDGTLHASPANYTLADGDSLALDYSAGTDTADGTFTVILAEIIAVGNPMVAGLNQNFEVQGTSMTSALCTYSTSGGIILTTAGTDNDQAIIVPHLDTNLTAWAMVDWLTTKRPLLETTIVTGATVTLAALWVGFKLTVTSPWAKGTDADQLMVFMDTDTDNKLRYIYSITGESDVEGILTNAAGTQLAIAASTRYDIQVGLDELRRPYIIVNGELYLHGNAMTDALATLIPQIGVQETGESSAKAISVKHLACSRDI